MPLGGPKLRTKDGKMNLVGERVRQRRRELGWTQDNLGGTLARVTEGQWAPSRKEVGRIEDGERVVCDTELVALASALQCSVIWLLTGT